MCFILKECKKLNLKELSRSHSFFCEKNSFLFNNFMTLFAKNVKFLKN